MYMTWAAETRPGEAGGVWGILLVRSLAGDFVIKQGSCDRGRRLLHVLLFRVIGLDFTFVLGSLRVRKAWVESSQGFQARTPFAQDASNSTDTERSSDTFQAPP